MTAKAKESIGALFHEIIDDYCIKKRFMEVDSAVDALAGLHDYIDKRFAACDETKGHHDGR